MQVTYHSHYPKIYKHSSSKNKIFSFMKYKYFMNKFKIAIWYGIQVPKGNVVNWLSIGIVNVWVY